MPRGLSGTIALMVLALCVSPFPALAQKPAPGGLPETDVRDAKPQGVPKAMLGARTALRRRLGPEGVVETDPVSGGARVVQRTDGLLTGPSEASPEAVALGYVRAHRSLFGLSDADLAGLRLTLRDTTVSGLTSLEWRQVVDGVPAYDSTLAATVTADGELVSIQGSAVPGLDVASSTPGIGAARARAIAAADVGGRASRATASLTVLGAASGGTLAWRVLAWDGAGRLFDVVVDAGDGSILVRHSLTDEYSGATVFRRHPGSAVDATGYPVDLGADPSWLSLATTTSPASLRGNNVHAYADRGGVDGFDAGEDIAPSSGLNWNYPLTPMSAGSGCPQFGGNPACTWDGASETVNRAQAATQLFWFANVFHDHLASAPIGFTHASRNFEAADADGAGPGLGGDAVKAEVDDASGLNNANMTTPPDGSPPRLQMYLFTNPYLNGADVADVVYHEYAHGLSNRLIGNGTGLSANQSQALGEGWSDWYAFDFLAAQGDAADTAADGELLSAAYLFPNGAFSGGPPGVRTQALDCSVGSSHPNCPGRGKAGPGGYTLGDLGRINGNSVHANGEIWVETLWDIRKALGSQTTERLVTDAMRLSPLNPSFLDERNAILAADQAQGGTHHDVLWQLFAARGMGFSAEVADAGATRAYEAFDLPPMVAHGGAAVDDAPPIGDGDGYAEPGEAVRLAETLWNPSAFALTGVFGALSATDDTIVGGPWTTWPTLAPGASAAGSTPLAVTIPAGHACGQPLALSLQVTTDEGPQALAISVPTGAPGTLASPNAADTPKAIPDASATGVTSSLTVAAPGLVKDVNVRIASITHSFDADLTISLIAPDGTTVVLADGRGGSGNNFTNTVFDDQAGADVNSGSAPFTGSFRPEERLRALNGRPANGTWRLKVVDGAPFDTGSIVSWGIDERPAVCATSAAAAPSAATGAASAVTASSAALAGTVDPGGSATESAFQYGTTTAYGAQSGAAAAGSGTGAAAASVQVAGLRPATTYHYRAAALRGGTPVAVGEDRTFTTAAAPAGTGATTAGKPGGTVDGTQSQRGRVRFTRSPKRVVATRARTFRFTLEATRGYRGAVRFVSDRALAAKVRAHARRRLGLGKSAFPSTRKAERLTVRAKLSVRAWRTLRRMRKIRVRVSVVLDGRTFVARFVLQAPKRKPRR